MLDGDALSWSNDGDGTELGSACWHVLGLDTSERGLCAIGSGEREGVGGDGGQGASGVVQDLDGLATSVGEGGGDFEVVDAINGGRA